MFDFTFTEYVVTTRLLTPGEKGIQSAQLDNALFNLTKWQWLSSESSLLIWLLFCLQWHSVLSLESYVQHKPV